MICKRASQLEAAQKGAFLQTTSLSNHLQAAELLNTIIVLVFFDLTFFLILTHHKSSLNEKNI